MSLAELPILSVMQAVPAAGALLPLLLRGGRRALAAAFAVAALELALALALYHGFDATAAAFQFAERRVLVGPLAYGVAADGLTVLFMLLTAFLTVTMVLYAAIRRFDGEGLFLAVVLASEAALMSQFASTDLGWFVLASAVQIGLAGMLLRRWATSPEEGGAVLRFHQFMGVGLALLLAGTLLLGWLHDDRGGGWSFDLFALMAHPVPESLRSAVFYLLFYGLAVRVPLFPLHGWLPAAAEHGTVAPALVMLLGLKTGVYGLLRFVFPLVPEAVAQWQPYVIAFAAAGIFYAALLALMQDNLRRLLAYAVVSHTSVMVIGLFSLEPQALQGSVILAVNFGLAAAALLFMTGLVFKRTHTLLLPRLGGLFDSLPMIAIAFLVAGLAIVGMPGTPGFDAVHLVLEAAMRRFGALVTIAAALGNVAAAGFLLWAFQRMFLAAPPPGANRAVAPASPAELALAGSMIVVQLAAGFFSEPWLHLVEASTARLAVPFAALTPGGP